jgi:hypothetical protein
MINSLSQITKAKILRNNAPIFFKARFFQSVDSLMFSKMIPKSSGIIIIEINDRLLWLGMICLSKFLR